VVSSRRKLALLTQALAASLDRHEGLVEPGHPAAQFLLDAVTASTHRGIAAVSGRKRIVDRAVWVIDLFERLERRDQLLRDGQTP
jgi:phytoene synthase